MMYEQLYRYFILHKQLTVPGIGTFFLERKPAESDFLNKQFLPPSYSVSLQKAGSLPAQKFFGWLAAALHISDRQAFEQFNDFAADVKKQLENGATVEWEGIGTLQTGLEGTLKFSPVHIYTEEAVKAEKVIREKAEHTVRVGEQEKTSAQMIEILSHHETKRSYWWPAAIILLVLAFIFTSWYIVRNGLGTASAANTKKASAAEAGQSYKILP